MDGVVTRVPEITEDPTLEVAFYEVKDVTGRRTDPLASAVNMISCHGDSSLSEEQGYRTVDESDRPATRERRYFDWGYVCPTNEEYQAELLELIDRCSAVNEAVRLDDVGFARPEFCHCDRCNELFEAAMTDDRWTWRTSVVSSFLEHAAAAIDGRVYLTLYPDPYPGHLRRRSGLDLSVADSLADEVVVPLYDLAYETTYWLEVIAAGFEDAISSADLGIELYGVDIEQANLVHAAEVAGAYAQSVYVAYDAEAAHAVSAAVEE